MSADQVPQVKKGHGCFFYGCLTSVVIAILLAIVIGVVVLKVKNMAKEYTSDKPAEVEMVELPAEQIAAFDSKVQAFEQAMKEDKPARLVLTAPEINGKLNSSPEFRRMGGRASVRIEGDQIYATISLPMDSLKASGLPVDRMGLAGRYFNGGAKFHVGLQSGRLLIFCDQLDANGKPVPEWFMKDFRSKNLAEEAMKDPDTAAAIAKIRRVAVENGSIVVEK